MLEAQCTSHPTTSATALRLHKFSSSFASLIVEWVRDVEELFWLAPSVTPPLSPEKVVAWGRDAGSALVLADAAGAVIGYAELNPMREAPSHLWIGHLIVDPARRGHGRGEAFTRLLLDHAFFARRASMVSLIVFPENRAALRCYVSAGFTQEGEQFHTFGRSNDRHRMLHLVARPTTGAGT